MRYDLEDIKRIVQGETKKKKCNKNWMMLGVGLIAMAAMAGAVWYFFLKDKNKDNDDDWDDDDWDDDDDDDDDDDMSLVTEDIIEDEE